MKPSRVEQLQPPVERDVTVRAESVPVVDPELLARFDRWMQKLLNAHATSGEGR